MSWVLLIGAGCCEVLGVTFMRYVVLRKGVKFLILQITAFILSFFLLSLAMHTISMSTAYAVWTGIGTVGTALTGMLLYGESKEWRRLVLIAIVMCSAVGLKLFG